MYISAKFNNGNKIIINVKNILFEDKLKKSIQNKYINKVYFRLFDFKKRLKSMHY